MKEINPREGLSPPQLSLPPLTGWLHALWAYVELSKPASIILLVFTGLASYVVASRGQVSAQSALLILLAGIAGSAGANATTCYVDRDIDAIMKRTQRRPLPAGKIRPPERALHYGLGMMAIALTLAALRGPLTFALMLLGLLDNVVVYSLLTKRHSRWNVLWGGISGGVPVAFGWSVATGSLNLTAVLMAALVVLWIPNHIWNLAIVHTEDYRRVRVPMLPVATDLASALRCLASTVVLLYAVSLALYFLGHFGIVYLAVTAPLGLVLTIGNLYVALRPSKERAWLMFKLSSPYLLLLFAGMMMDVLL